MVARILHGARSAALLLMTALMAQGFFAPAASAQDEHGQMTRPQAQQQQHMQGETLLRGDHLIGMEVQNPQGQKLGKVANIAIDRSLDKASYAAVSRGGVFGMGGEHVAVPIQALTKEPGKNFLTLNVSEEQFKKAPAFKENKWPAHPDMQYWTQVGAIPKGQPMQEHGGMQGTEPGEHGQTATQGEAGAPVFKLTQIINDKVNDRQGKDIGKIDDVYIDMHEGRLVYGLVAFRPVEGLKNKMAVVPWSVLKVQPETRTASVDASLSTLQAVAFSPRNFPRLDQQYLSRISQRFNTEPYWEVYGYPPPQPAPTGKQPTKQHEGY